MPLKDVEARKAYMRKYREEHKERLNELGRIYYWQNLELQRQYKRDAVARKRKALREGLVGHLIEQQDGLCAICGQPETVLRNNKLKDLALDHDHTSGQLRELLCQRCNTTIGLVDDNIELLEKMIDYILKHSKEELVLIA